MFTVEDHSPVHLLATDEGMERVIIKTLIKELNEKFNVGLDSNFLTSRSVLPDSHEDQLLPGEIIVIGSSHASRIATALSSQGEQVKCLASPFWRLKEEDVKTTVEALEKEVGYSSDATIIYHIFNSSIYFACGSTGEKVLPKRREDGRYHVEGDLVLADWDTFKRIFSIAAPLLRAGGNLKKIVLSPLPRYATNKCCSNSAHLTNAGTRGYAKKIGSAIADIHGWIEDLAHGRRIKNMEVVCPSSIIGLRDDSNSTKHLGALWGADPVQLTPSGYGKIAESLAKEISEDRTSPSTNNSDKQPQPLETPKADWREGISRSDTVIKRWGREQENPMKSRTPGHKGRPRGGHPYQNQRDKSGMR